VQKEHGYGLSVFYENKLSLSLRIIQITLLHKKIDFEPFETDIVVVNRLYGICFCWSRQPTLFYFIIL